MSETRIDELEQFVSHAAELKLDNDDQFRQFVVDSLRILEMTDREFADSLSVSRPCVNRWSNGKNLPRPATRKATVEYVAKRVNQKIKTVVRQTTARVKVASSTSAYRAHAYPVAAKGR